MKHLVIAQYDEDLRWINDLPNDWHIFVYCKSGQTTGFNANFVTKVNLPNEGREGGTFLHHIISRYEGLGEAGLAEVTVFVQGRPGDHIRREELLAQLSRADLIDTTVEGLGPWLVCNDVGWPHHLPPSLPIRELADSVQLSVGSSLSFVAGGQWLVGRSLIKQHPKHFYEMLRAKLLEHEVFGYCLERIWPRIWTPKQSAILYYSHHTSSNPKVPEPIRQAVRHQIETFRPEKSSVFFVGDLEGSSRSGYERNYTNKDGWICIEAVPGKRWNYSIYKAIEVGLEAIEPGTLVFMAEHDVLYPADYWAVGKQQYRPGHIGYANNIFFLNGLGYWTYRPSGYQSTVYGDRDILLSDVRARLNFMRTRLANPKLFDLGKGDDFPAKTFEYSSNWPVLDIRFEQNGMVNASPTGTMDKAHVFYNNVPYWGEARVWQAKLGITETHGFRELGRQEFPSTDPDFWNQHPDPHEN